MCEVEKKIREWFDSALPRITANLGDGFDDGEARYELSIPSDSFYLSSTYYVNIRAKNGTGKRIGLVAKRPPQHEPMRRVIQSDDQFHNEILFYRRYATDDGREDFPRCVYSESKPPCDTMIVLENVAERGFGHSSWKYEAPPEYTLAAIREIARFHAKGYVAKERRPGEFFGLVRSIRETRYQRHASGERFGRFVDLLASRAIDYLRRQNYEREFCDRMERFLNNAFENVMLRTVERPVEPLATLCHGDFTLNNVLFKNENDGGGGGGGVKAMLIDFALIRYGSPAIDLSTYLCLCAAKHLSGEKFTEILKAYHGSVTEYLSNNNVRNMERFSYEAFYEDFKRGGLFGFVIASFYLKTLMGKDTLPVEQVFELDVLEVAKVHRQDGGEEISKILADMLLDLRELGCLEHCLCSERTPERARGDPVRRGVVLPRERIS